jgi:hypothetical protein
MADVVLETDFPGATIRRRKKNENKWSDANCTPKWLADMLYESHGEFDFDPCSNPRSHIRARWSWGLEKGINGLKMPWRGSGFQNHPYSSPMEWMLKGNTELSTGQCTELVVLTKMDCSTEWWGVLTSPIAIGAMHRGRPELGLINAEWFTPDLWLFNDRIEFDEHPESIEDRKRKIMEAKAAGKKPPPEKTSNNFCSAIVHHRFELPPLKLEKVATLWRRP